MGNCESNEALSDVELEREIEQALSVEPSPDFVARVRTVVTADRVRAGWHGTWIWLGVATSGIALATVLLLTRSEPLQLPVLKELPRAHEMSSALPSLPRLPVPDLHPRSPRTPRARGAKAVSEFAPEPEVLIAQDEAATLKRLMRGRRTGRVEPSTLEPSRVAQAGPPPTIVVSPLRAIAPITIDPLGFEGGERQ
jgi:hypothetical protein